MADHALLSLDSAVHISLDAYCIARHAPVSKHAAAAVAVKPRQVYRCVKAQILQARIAMHLLAGTILKADTKPDMKCL